MSTRTDHPGEIAATLIGASRASSELRHDLELAAGVSLGVMIAGEYGVGKKRLAHLIHRRSTRRNAPFVVIRCSEGSQRQIDGRLFGRSAKGRSAFERADGGTLFLYDVGSLSPRLQSRLAEFIATRTSMGSRGNGVQRQLDVRLICATTAPLVDPKSRFREDLYYLLNGIYLAVPPLRERPEDVEPLLDYFTSYYARRSGVSRPTLTEEWRASCRAHDWPGNVRQLQAAAAILVAPNGPVTPRQIFQSVADVRSRT